MMNSQIRLIINIVIGYAVLFILQIWFDLLSAAVFVKLSITIVIVLGVLVMIAMVKRATQEEDRQTKDRYLN